MTLERVEEFFIHGVKAIAIRQLFDQCFPGYPPDRVYYKQLPSFRYLAWEGEQLIAHLAIEHRVVNIGGQSARIFGFVDFCVHPDYQHQRIASQLLGQAEQLAAENKIDFILLVASNPGFYKTHGFYPIQNPCRWLMLVNHRTLGIARRTLPNTLMVKDTSGRHWPEGELDFMGTVF